MPGYTNEGFGRGFRMGGAWGHRGGRGGGWGRGRWMAFMPGVAGGAGPYAAMPTPEQERQALKAQASSLEEALAGIRQRLDALESESEPK
jgi:hypothetical protein